MKGRSWGSSAWLAQLKKKKKKTTAQRKARQHFVPQGIELKGNKPKKKKEYFSCC